MAKGVSIVEETRTIFDPDTLIDQATNEIIEDALVDESNDDEEGLRHLLEQRYLHKTLLWHQKPNVYILFFALLIYFISRGVSLSSQIVLILDVMCRNAAIQTEISTCDDPKVQELASQLQSILMFVTGLVSSLVSGKIGELSDRFGRRPVLVVIGIVSVISSILQILLLSPSTPYHKSWFVCVVAFENVCGGTVGLLSVANSFITDIADPEERVMLLGFSNGALYAGLGFGPLLGSLILSATGDIYSTLYAASALGVLFLTTVVFLIHESRPKVLRRRSQSVHLQRKASFASTKSTLKDASLTHFLNLFSPLKTLWAPKHKTLGYIPRFNILLLIAVESIVLVCGAAVGPVLALYLRYMFHTSPEFLGYFVSVIGFSKTAVLYVISPFLLYFMKKHFQVRAKSLDSVDFILVLIGSIFESLSPLTIVLATHESQVFVAGISGSLGALAIPSVQGTIIKYVQETKIGEVFGGIALIKNLLIMVTPSIFLSIYGNTVTFAPKFVFYVILGFVATGIIFALLLKVHEDPDALESDVESSLYRPSYNESYGATVDRLRRESTSSIAVGDH